MLFVFQHVKVQQWMCWPVRMEHYGVWFSEMNAWKAIWKALLNFFDATYMLLEIILPICLALCEDSVGNSEIVSVGMLSVEDEASLHWMFETLRTQNQEMNRVWVIVTDKDMKERQVLWKCFPNTCLLICIFHTLCTFKREITCEKWIFLLANSCFLWNCFKS